jgi:hypothetical protein
MILMLDAFRSEQRKVVEELVGSAKGVPKLELGNQLLPAWKPAHHVKDWEELATSNPKLLRPKRAARV